MPRCTPHPDTARLDRRDAVVSAAIFALGLAVRLVFLARTPDAAWPHAAAYEGDAIVWTQWAQALGRGEPFEFDLAFRTPGVAWTLHLLGLADGPYTAAKALWCVLSALTPAILYLCLARFASRPAGVVAAALSACSFQSLVLSTSLNNEAPYALAALGAIFATLAWIARPRLATAALAGVLHAAALHLRAEHLAVVGLIVPIMAVAAAVRATASWRVAMLHAVALCLVVAAALAPWTIRGHRAAVRMNTESPGIPYDSMWPEWSPDAIAAFESLPAYARSGNFAPFGKWLSQSQVRTVDGSAVRRYFDEAWGTAPDPLPEWPIVSMKGPLDFALANHPGSDGGFSRGALADDFDQNPPFAFARPSHANLAVHGYEVGLGWIRERPAAWGGLVREKLRRFGDGVTGGLFADNWPYGPGGRREAVDIVTPRRDASPLWRTTVITAILAGALACCARGMRTLGAVLGVVVFVRIAVVVAFYGYARQAAAIGPVLDAFAGIGVAACAAWVARLFPEKTAHAAGSVAGSAGRIALPALLVVARFIVAVFAVAFLAVAFRSSWNAPRFMARSADPDAPIVRNELLGAGAFEGADDVILDPAVVPGQLP